MKGMTDVLVHCNGQSEALPVYVTRENFTAIVGRTWLKKIGQDRQEVRKLSTYSMQLQSVFEKRDQIFRDELDSMSSMSLLSSYISNPIANLRFRKQGQSCTLIC